MQTSYIIDLSRIGHWLQAVLLLLSVAVLSVTLVQPAFAQTVREDDLEAIYYDWTFYDIVPLGSCGAAADAAPVKQDEKDRIKAAFQFFVNKGLTANQAAGIIGNLRQESGMDPASHNTAAPPAGTSPSSIIPGETWNGGGIAQWEDYRSQPGRWSGPNGILQFVAGKGTFAGKPQGDGKNWKVLNYQLEFMWWELNNTEKAALAHLKGTKTLEEATRSFVEMYERASVPALGNRLTYAKEALDAFGDLAPNGTTACGGSGAVVDGYAFPVAPQKKRSYTNLPCPASNPNSRTSNYYDKFGTTTRILTCHHDGTPAYDLMYSDVAGKQVYALTDGTLENVTHNYLMSSAPGSKPCGTIQLQAADGSGFYWYGHILPGQGTDKKIARGVTVKAGDVLGIVATRDYGTGCFGGGPHLHIDRGCKNPGNGQWQTGGEQDLGGCRDPQFLQDLQKIWEGLDA